MTLKSYSAGRALYVFAAGYSVSVIPDPTLPLHFEALVRLDDDQIPAEVADQLETGRDGLAGRLTSDQARNLLDRVAALAKQPK
jgi:hypothetical protein